MSYVRNHSGIYVPRHLGRVDMVGMGRDAAVGQLPDWAPTSETEIEQWAAQQVDVWERPEVQSAISDTKHEIGETLGQGDPEFVLPAGRTMNGDEIADWAFNDIQQNGFPDSPDEAAAMSMRFLDQQGQSLGFHPGFVGKTADLLGEGWPQSPEAAAAWGTHVGDAIMQQYGISLPSDWDVKGVAQAAASAACLQAGVPFVGVVTTSIDSVWDGKLTYGEIRNIIVAVGSAVGAAVGQMFGIPAPIGAFVGAIATDLIMGLAEDVFGWGDNAAERRGKAWKAMLEAKAAMEAQCLEAATSAWTSYNEYWNLVDAELTTSLNSSAAFLGEGIRSFGSKQVAYLEGEGIKMWGVHLPDITPLPNPISRVCDRPEGCLYFAEYNDKPGGYIRRPWPAPPATLDRQPKPADISPVPNYQGALQPDGTYSPYAALAYYGAERYVTPWHANLDRMGIKNYVMPLDRLCWTGGRFSGGYTQCWSAALHTDREYLEALSNIRSALRPEELEMCVVPEWAEFMMAQLTQVGPALAFVMGDVSGTISAVAAEQAVVARMQGDLDEYQLQRRVTVQAAQERRDILRMRRNRASREARMRYGALALGTGGIAGLIAAKMFGGKL